MEDLFHRVGQEVLGRWKIDALLGAGGMSVVYSALHRSNAKRVAIKVLHPHLVAIPELVARFNREGFAANRIGHPGAVAVFDDGLLADGTPCLVMEHLVGGSLDHWMEKRGPMATRDALLVIDSLLDVLAAAHRVGVIHRDVKPENIFVTERGDVKLLDFGIARSGETSGTMTGATMGTPAYMPPEQAEGRWGDTDGRVDVFAAGAVALALLGGTPPRIGETANLILVAAMSEPLATTRERGLDVSDVVAAVIDRAVAPRSEDRWPSAEAMAAALREAWGASRGEPLARHAESLAYVGRFLAGAASASGPCPATPAPRTGGPSAPPTAAALMMPSPDASMFAGSTPLPNGASARSLRGGFVAALAVAAVVAAALGIGVTRWFVGPASAAAAAELVTPPAAPSLPEAAPASPPRTSAATEPLPATDEGTAPVPARAAAPAKIAVPAAAPLAAPSSSPLKPAAAVKRSPGPKPPSPSDDMLLKRR